MLGLFILQYILQLVIWYFCLKLTSKVEQLDGEIFKISLLIIIPIPIFGLITSIIMFGVALVAYFEDIDFFENVAEKLSKRWDKDA